MQGDASDPKDKEAAAGPYWSLMFEISESDEKAVNMEETDLGGKKWASLVKESIIGALNTKMVSAEDQIVSIYHRCAMLEDQPLARYDALSATGQEVHHH